MLNMIYIKSIHVQRTTEPRCCHTTDPRDTHAEAGASAATSEGPAYGETKYEKRHKAKVKKEKQRAQCGQVGENHADPRQRQVGENPTLQHWQEKQQRFKCCKCGKGYKPTCRRSNLPKHAKMCNGCEQTCDRNQSDQASLSAELLMFPIWGSLRERQQQLTSTSSARAQTSIATADTVRAEGLSDETEMSGEKLSSQRYSRTSFFDDTATRPYKNPVEEKFIGEKKHDKKGTRQYRNLDKPHTHTHTHTN